MLSIYRRQARRMTALGGVRSMSFLDNLFSYGNTPEPTSASVTGSSGYQLVLLGYVSKRMVPKDSLQEILKQDPNFLMGHVLVGASEYLHPQLHADSQDAVRRVTVVKELLAKGQASEQEKYHVHALDALVHGRFREASTIYEKILQHDKTDLLALQCSVDIYSILGDKRNVLDTVSRILPQLPGNHPGYSHVLALQSFGLQEIGDYTAAENLANRALSMNEEDGGAFHTLLHTCESQGKHQDGASIVHRYQDSWGSFALLRQHVYHHWMLFLIETGRFDRVMQLLKTEFFTPQNEILSSNALVDVTQVYWRLRFAGFDAPHLLDELERQWKVVANDTTVKLTPLATVNAHSILSLKQSDYAQLPIHSDAFACNLSKLREDVEAVTQFSYGLPGNGEVQVLENILSAFTSYAKGDYQAAVSTLLATRGHAHVMGGTRVEAELLELLLIDSARCSSQLELARTLLNERINVKPQSAQYWKTHGDILEDLNDAEGVDGSRRMSYVLGLGQAGTNAS